MGKNFKNFNILIFIPSFFLAGLSLILILSAAPDLFSSQLLYFFIGFLIFFLLNFFDVESLLKSLTFPVYTLLVISLSLPFFAPQIRGAHRWFEILGVNIQPSELGKPLFIAFFAQMISLFPPQKIRNFLVNFFLLLLPFFIIFKQPDLGNAVLYLGTWLAMTLAGGLNLVFGLWSLVFGLVAGPFFWHFLKDYQQLRILSFLAPQKYAQTASYHSIQAQISVGSGQLLGKGLGRGTQSHLKFLPEYYTDFIFASLCEELGFMGGFFILCCYFFLLFKILKMATESKTSFAYLYSIGFFAQLSFQVLINVGMSLGLVPITGITLPLLSYGGSSIISTLIGLGILTSFLRKERPEIFVLG